MTILSGYEFEDTATHLVYRVGRLIRYRAASFFKQRNLDITPEQWGLLLRITKTTGIALGKLTDKTLGDYPNITRLADGLEKMGFIERAHNPDDRRSFLVHATPAGEAFIESILPELMETKGEMYEGLDEKDIQCLNALLKRIETNIESME